jgi:hypothetical protein
VLGVRLVADARAVPVDRGDAVAGQRDRLAELIATYRHLIERRTA